MLQTPENVLLKYDWPGNVRELISIATDISQYSKGYLEEEDVRKIFNDNDIDLCGGSDNKNIIENRFVTEEQFQFAVKYGLKDFTKKLKKSIFEEEYKRNGNVVRSVREKFSINHETYKNIMNFKESTQ